MAIVSIGTLPVTVVVIADEFAIEVPKTPPIVRVML